MTLPELTDLGMFRIGDTRAKDMMIRHFTNPTSRNRYIHMETRIKMTNFTNIFNPFFHEHVKPHINRLHLANQLLHKNEWRSKIPKYLWTISNDFNQGTPIFAYFNIHVATINQIKDPHLMRWMRRYYAQYYLPMIFMVVHTPCEGSHYFRVTPSAD
ncbi:MAG: hypothetical protein K0U41_06785 [Gammaproteobacteria bacterium]|nr:hypothetical protein [Gammaproteobacteria bacterium]